MGTVAIVLRKPPYGDICASEAVRHALGGAVEGMGVHLILVDSGVLLARKGHDGAETGMTNLETVLRDCIASGVVVIADNLSVREERLDKEMLIEGTEVADGPRIAEIVRDAQWTMIF